MVPCWPLPSLWCPVGPFPHHGALLAPSLTMVPYGPLPSPWCPVGPFPPHGALWPHPSPWCPMAPSLAMVPCWYAERVAPRAVACYGRLAMGVRGGEVGCSHARKRMPGPRNRLVSVAVVIPGYIVGMRLTVLANAACLGACIMAILKGGYCCMFMRMQRAWLPPSRF